MNLILPLVVLFVIASSSFAAGIEEKNVVSLIDNWLAAQNTGSFTKYAALYSKNFVGIRRSGTTTRKFDHDAWLQDRQRMFKKKMQVTLRAPEITLSDTTASIKFEQTWESGAYKDKGEKVLNLALENGGLKIVREEMLFSTVNLVASKVQEKYESKFTSIRRKDCKQSKKLIEFTSEDYVEECPAVDGWKLFKVYEHEGRSWIDIAYGRNIWSSQNQVWNDPEYNFGQFPGIESTHVEWMMAENGEPTALIFQVTAQDPDAPSRLLARLFVLRLSNNVPFFCGMAKTSREARELANNATTCTTTLEKRILPSP